MFRDALIMHPWRGPWLVRVLAVATFGCAAAGAFWAQATDRPITAAIIFLFGVTVVGALEGFAGGLVAAFAASAIYNFFISEPLFSFSLSSPDEYVPLVAFNVSAVASALLVGRLRDRARVAERAEQRLRVLLEVSQRLQSAVTLDEVAYALEAFGARNPEAGPPEIFVPLDGQIVAATETGRALELAQAAWLGSRGFRQDGQQVVILSGAAGPFAVLVLADTISDIPSERDIESFTNLVSIAVERCLLLSRLAEAELVRRSEELKTALLSSVSHDMRTPLSIISASASSLSHYGSQLPDDTNADLLRLIEEQCARLDRYTTNLLNLGRIQAGLDTSRWSDCDPVEVLGTAISNVRALGTKHGFKKNYEAVTSAVRADPVMLEQVFYNVLENAVLYSPQESNVTIELAEEPEHVIILIGDEGPGIAERDREQVFDRFSRASAGLVREGSGLGLSIAKGFVEAFGGSIQALFNERVGRGTCIRIKLARSRLGAAP